MNLSAAERKFLGRDQPSDGLQVVRAEGSYLFDAKGKKYIDFVMGWCVGNLGWGRPETREGIRRFKGPDYVSPDYGYKPWVELAKLLAAITPGALTKSFRATGGTEAVDLALQAAMLHTRRGKFLSLEDSYHGNSVATLSIGASENRRRLNNLLPRCAKIEPPLDDTTLDKIETHLKHRDVAAVIVEPIPINLGVLQPGPGFMPRLQELCRRYGTLLIADEVATGFGRTGRLFASEHFDLEPDVMCLAKAISGGGAALAAMIATPDVARSMEERGAFYSTYGWHPLSVDVAIANIRYIVKHKARLLGHVLEMSDYFHDRLLQMKFEEASEIRMEGLAIGVDVNSEGYAAKIQERARKAGLLITTAGSTVMLLPALTIDQATAGRGLDILQAAA